MTGVPVERMEEAESSRLRKMGATLKSAVIAQDKAIDTMVKAIQRNRVGLKEPNHPIGAFMFLGPTGVGKTYLAKKLAELMFGSADALIRVDMSEYSESFNTSRLVGAPPGYVGYETGGIETLRVLAHINANQGVGRAKHQFCQLLGEISFSHTSRSQEHKGPNGMVGFFQPNTVALDGFHHSVDGLILGDDSTLEGGAHLAQTTALSFLHAFNGYARHTAHHLRHVDFVYRQDLLAFATFSVK
jgi:energy-coupling factor transporter ATP-binding protein EcfA2